LEVTNERLHLKDGATFALLISISPHTIIMLNEINNFFGLNAILNGEPIGLGNHVSQQCGYNIRENSNRGDNRL